MTQPAPANRVRVSERHQPRHRPTRAAIEGLGPGVGADPGRDRSGRGRHLAVRRRHGRAGVLLALAISVALVGWDATHQRTEAPVDARVPLAALPIQSAAQPWPAAQPSPAAQAPVTSTPAIVVDRGPGTFSYATGGGPIVGVAGTVRRYRVAVEDGVGVAASDFAAAVDAILADPRSWIAGGNVRFQRVASAAGASFTVFLATPATSETMCREDWLETAQFTNCRLTSGKVVINLARWLTAVPGYGAGLDVYRAYAINHEVGHQLGHGHELCPGPGQPAPVMQQQTYGLQGCVANGWPYLDGVRYRGPPTG